MRISFALLLTVTSLACGGPAPIITALNATRGAMSAQDTVTFLAVVEPATATGLLLSDDGVSVYGAFAAKTAGSAPELTLTWAQLDDTRSIDFIDREDRRFIARFFSATGEHADAKVTVRLSCDGQSACHGHCVDLSVGRQAINAANLYTQEDCGTCGTSCGPGGGCAAGVCSKLSACIDNSETSFSTCTAYCEAHGARCSSRCLAGAIVWMSLNQASCEDYSGLYSSSSDTCDTNLAERSSTSWSSCCCTSAP